MKALSFLRPRASALLSEIPVVPDGAQDDADLETSTVFLLALRPEGAGRHPQTNFSSKLIDWVVRVLQPGSPVFAHVELVIPDAGKPGIFATYYRGSNDKTGADWQHPSTYEEISYARPPVINQSVS